jgi:hypothetical protein
MKAKYSPGFMAGWVTLLCWNQAFMDFVGKEKYIETVRVSWVDTRWWYWPILLVAYMFLEMVVHCFRETK